MPFTPLGDALDQKFRSKTPLKKQVQASMAVEYATEVLLALFGPEQGALVKPLFLKNRTLTVTCTTSAMAQEIRLRQHEIVAKINEKLGEKQVDRIRYLA